MMPSNSDVSVQQIHAEFQELVDYVTDEESWSRSAHEVELTLFKRLLALGARLLHLFFVHRASVRPTGPIHAPDGTRLKPNGRRSTTYFSVFGKLTFKRHYFYALGHEGICPLDAELDLPSRCYSHLLRDWAEFCSTDESYDESIAILDRILGISLSKQALETGVREDAVDVEAFYEQKAVPSVDAEGPILIAQADGKGVPMVRDRPAPRRARRGKGQKRTKKKEAVVISMYTIAPYPRTPQQVADALIQDASRSDDEQTLREVTSVRPVPVGKEVRATLEGKEVAFAQMAHRVEQRDGNHITHRVALTDGAPALQRRMQETLPSFTLVLDVIHVSEYLWSAANALFGETHPERTSWVREQLLHLLRGNTSTVIETLQERKQDASLSPSQRDTLETTIGYYQRNQPYMRYDRYLERGWPIGTGVVEGACGHLVKDRMERAGMRWTEDGAQALLDLRAVRINGDWSAYQKFHRERQHMRLYGAQSTTVAPEIALLEQAA